MCDIQHGLPPLEEDEYVLETPLVREFVGGVRAKIDEAGSPEQACELIAPLFRPLLTDPTWLPERYQEPATRAAWAAASGSGFSSAPPIDRSPCSASSCPRMR